MVEYSPPANKEVGKETAFFGQTLEQVRHWIHSGKWVSLGFFGMAPIGQFFWHFRHSLQSWFTFRLKRARGEIRLSKAPRGQRNLHQKRGARRLRAMIPPKIRNVIADI